MHNFPQKLVWNDLPSKAIGQTGMLVNQEIHSIKLEINLFSIFVVDLLIVDIKLR